MLKDKIIVLGITGSIAAYKSAELARLLVKRKAKVKVIMTTAALNFITPLTFETITANKVATSLFEPHLPDETLFHITLAREADLILIAPATANIIAKIAQGIADDLLSSTVIDCTCPLIIAPAMHKEMYLNPATLQNIETLNRRGIRLVGPEEGELASGDEGIGRLADLFTIIQAVEEELARKEDLKGIKVLVTAGGTREPIDPVRYISNRSSGKMGYFIAAEAKRRGAQVVLVSAPTSLVPLDGIDLVQVVTAEEMRTAVFENMASSQVLIMAAAVADFKPASFKPEKIKKDSMPSSIELSPTADILKEAADIKGDCLFVGFALESELDLREAKRKLIEKNLDLIAVNTFEYLGADKNQITFVNKDGAIPLPLLYKEQAARAVIDEVVKLFKNR